MSPQADFEDLFRERERIWAFRHYIGLGVSLGLLLAACSIIAFMLRGWLEPFDFPEPVTAVLSVVILVPGLIVSEWVIVTRFIRNESFNCPYCRRHIEVLSPWTCGQCHHTMRLSRLVWTFFRSCRACRNVPQYVKCPYCHVPVPIAHESDPNFMTVCARHEGDSELLVYTPPKAVDGGSVPDGFERKSEAPLVVAWRRAREDNLVIWWTRGGYPGFRVRGCRYPSVPTAPNEPDGQPIMAPSSAVTDRVDVGVSTGRHGNFGLWLEREGFQPAGFVGFGVPPGAAVSAPKALDPHDERRKRNRAKLSEIEQIYREWLDEDERLARQLEGGEISRVEHDQRKEITEQLFETQINGLTGPERV